MKHHSAHDFRDLKTGEYFTVELDIDIDALARRLAARVARSKTRKAVTADGAIVMREIKRHEGI